MALAISVPGALRLTKVLNEKLLGAYYLSHRLAKKELK
jgi:hypothetical protein